MKKKSQASDLIGEDGRSKGKTSAADSSRSGSGQYDYSRNFGAINHLSSSFTTDEVSVDATSEKELAEDYCTEALNLDDHYIKAYSRRATARKELGKLKESIKAYYRFWICIEVGYSWNMRSHLLFYEHTYENDGNYLVKKSVYVKELGNKGSGAGSKSDGQVGNDSPANATPSSNVESVQALTLPFLWNGIAKNNRTRRQELKTSVIELASQAASRAMAEAAKNNTPPNSAYQLRFLGKAFLENDGNYLVKKSVYVKELRNKGSGAGSKSDGQVGNDSPANATPSSNVESVQVLSSFTGDRALQTHLLKATSPSALPQIFKNALSVPILIDIIKCVASFFIDDMDLAVKYLENLTKDPRFGVLIMCLSSTDMCGII
ncbi:hypothetical protein DKX38_006926 [Salix brachista]|uniref:RNA-polymerase II-associated protein 3-like C-terminal domain-containing protein n=1 Tax=Salix brachista TaxID=2182728 RepID=A0A5N5MM09_9ROSI|nr:hypothetical protein DKX38_006926 [Salix brachista]